MLHLREFGSQLRNLGLEAGVLGVSFKELEHPREFASGGRGLLNEFIGSIEGLCGESGLLR